MEGAICRKSSGGELPSLSHPGPKQAHHHEGLSVVDPLLIVCLVSLEFADFKPGVGQRGAHRGFDLLGFVCSSCRRPMKPR